MVVMALLAIAALAAGPAGADGHTLADGEAGDAGTHRFDAARHLVAQHHRLLDAHGAEAAMLEVVQVRAADAACAHAHLQLMRLERRRVDLFNAQVAGGVDDEGFHEVFFQSVAVTPPSTYRMWPLTKREASLARNTAAPTRSSTSPQRRDGVRPISQLLNSGLSTSAWFSSVLK